MCCCGSLRVYARASAAQGPPPLPICFEQPVALSHNGKRRGLEKHQRELEGSLIAVLFSLARKGFPVLLFFLLFYFLNFEPSRCQGAQVLQPIAAVWGRRPRQAVCRPPSVFLYNQWANLHLASNEVAKIWRCLIKKCQLLLWQVCFLLFYFARTASWCGWSGPFTHAGKKLFSRDFLIFCNFFWKIKSPWCKKLQF